MLPVGVTEETFVLLVGEVAHQHLIVHTVCGMDMGIGIKGRAKDALAFCNVCFAPVTPTVYGGAKHRLKKPSLFKLLYNKVRYHGEKFAIGTAKVEEAK